MKCYKGFDKDLKCRGFQYEIGKEYEENAADICHKGFHAWRTRWTYSDTTTRQIRVTAR